MPVPAIESDSAAMSKALPIPYIAAKYKPMAANRITTAPPIKAISPIIGIKEAISTKIAKTRVITPKRLKMVFFTL